MFAHKFLGAKGLYKKIINKGENETIKIKKILFFSPFAEISVHSVPEAELASALKKQGNDITLIRCRGLFKDVCISMSARGVASDAPIAEKQKICKSCIAKGNYLYKKYNLKTIFLDSFYQTLNKQKISNKIKQFALYEFFLDRKISSLNFSAKMKKQSEKYYKSAQKLWQVAPKILSLIRPDAVVTYNNYYGLNHIFSYLATKTGADNYTIHGGTSIPDRYNTLFLHRNYKQRFLWAKIPEWKKWQNVPLSKNQIKKVDDHITQLFNATDSWVYSTAWENKTKQEIHQFFGLNPKLKTFVLILSSLDEMFAAQKCDLFLFHEKNHHDQLEWIKQTVAVINKQKKANLIIRVHPREAPNKRESVISQNFKKMQILLRKVESNHIKVNWPDDNISIHDLAKITDICLNRTSTAGLEMMLHNVPVLQYSNTLLAYPKELNIQSSTLKKYQCLLRKFLTHDAPKPDLVKLFRWIYFKNHRVCGAIKKSRTSYYTSLLDKNIFAKSLWKKISFQTKWFIKKTKIKLLCEDKDDVAEIAKTITNNLSYYFKNLIPMPISSQVEKILIYQKLKKSLKQKN